MIYQCIRRHYQNEESPIADDLSRYRDFFALFGDFKGYVEFFLLQDLVSEDFSKVRFFMPFDNFTTSALPKTVESYEEFRKRSIAFIEARGKRMLQSVAAMASAA